MLENEYDRLSDALFNDVEALSEKYTELGLDLELALSLMGLAVESIQKGEQDVRDS